MKPFLLGPVKKGKHKSLHHALKTTLQGVDAYNNAMKHNGLPAVKLARGKPEFLIPTDFNTAQHGWSQQKPTDEFWQVLKDQLEKVTKGFNAFFKALAGDTGDRLQRWDLQRKVSPAGIAAVKGAMSGSQDVLDGYAVWPPKSIIKQRP